MIEEHFYTLLGEYLYALAMADGSVHEREIKELEKIVREELEDPEGDKEVILTKLRFFNCLNNNVNREEAAGHFIDFCREHAKRITPHQRQLTKALIKKVEEAYKGTLLPEENLVHRLEAFF